MTISSMTAEQALQDWGICVRGGIPRAQPSTNILYRVMREGPEAVALAYGTQSAEPEWPLYIKLTEYAISETCCRRDQAIAKGIYIANRTQKHVADDLKISVPTIKIRLEVIRQAVTTAINMDRVPEMACAT